MKTCDPPKKNVGGRPRNKQPPEDTARQKQLEELDAVMVAAETETQRVRDAWYADPTMALKRNLLAAELRCASIRRQWCILHNDDSHALKWGEQVTRLAKAHMEAAESVAIDEANALAKRQAAEKEVAGRVSRGR